MIETKPLIRIGTSHLLTIPQRWILHHKLDKKHGKGRGNGSKVNVEVTDEFIIVKPVKQNDNP